MPDAMGAGWLLVGDCALLYAEMPVQQLRGTSLSVIENILQTARPDDESVESVLAASTSGRLDSAFWDGRRKKRRHAWSLPTGVLYLVNRSLDFVYSELEQGRKLEENISIDLNHSVSTCFEQGRLGENKSILMSTSHKLDASNSLTTNYVNNLNGDEEFTCNTSHAILPASRLSTCFYLASVGDPTLEVELEQEKETRKMSETFLANLRTGERLLRLQSKNTKDNLSLSNTYITNLRGQHSVRLEAALPFWSFGNISKSFTTDFQQNHEFCLKTQHRISERNTLRTAFIRSLHHNNQMSVELKHVAQGTRDVAVKLMNNLHGTTQFKVAVSHIKRANC